MSSMLLTPSLGKERIFPIDLYLIQPFPFFSEEYFIDLKQIQ
jgi:hypothetical protein